MGEDEYVRSLRSTAKVVIPREVHSCKGESVYRNDVEGFKGIAQACGRLALACDSLTVTCQHREKSHLKCSTSSKIPHRQMYTSASCCTSEMSVSGLLGPAPDDTAPGFTAFQEVSINSVPVVKTIVHDHLEQLYARLSRASKEAPQPSYILQLTVPHELLTFTGPVLNRSVLMPQAGPLHGLLAQCLLSSWREAMPAGLLSEVEATANQLGVLEQSAQYAQCSTKAQLPQAAQAKQPAAAAQRSANVTVHRTSHSATPWPSQATSTRTAADRRSVDNSQARQGPYSLKRPFADARLHTGRSAMLKARRVLDRLSAPCVLQKHASARETTVAAKVSGSDAPSGVLVGTGLQVVSNT